MNNKMNITDINPQGPGPFAIPLLARFVSIDSPNPHQLFLLARFEFEDGVTLFVPISQEAAFSFAEMIQTLPAVWKSQGVLKDPSKTS